MSSNSKGGRILNLRHQIKLTVFKAANIVCAPLVYGYEKLFFPKRIFYPVGAVPNKVLLTNVAHLGDVVIATSMVAAIKQYYPKVNIGFLTASWSKDIIIGHPLIDHVHIFDHSHHHKKTGKIGWLHKLLIEHRTKKQTLHELRQVGYDAVIDLYGYYPSSMFLLWQARIPRRVGYFRCTISCLFTDPVEWKLENKHEARYQLKLVRTLFPDIPENIDLKPVLTRKTIDLSKLLPNTFTQDGFIVLHPGSGSPLKDWPIENWLALRKQLQELGVNIVVTGHGENEAKIISQICNQAKNCVNLCNKLNFDELVAVLAAAKLLVGVDSLAGHITAATATPSVIIFWGVVNYRTWQPLSSLTRIIFHHLSCVPCFKRSGCATMNCIRDVKVAEVLNAVLDQVKITH